MPTETNWPKEPSHIGLMLNSLMGYKWKDTHSNAFEVTGWTKTKLSTNHTYLIIFGYNQDVFYKFFKENFKGNILYESEPTKNYVHPSQGAYMRLIVFEVEQEEAPFGPASELNEQSDKVQPVSEMPQPGT